MAENTGLRREGRHTTSGKAPANDLLACNSDHRNPEIGVAGQKMRKIPMRKTRGGAHAVTIGNHFESGVVPGRSKWEISDQQTRSDMKTVEERGK